VFPQAPVSVSDAEGGPCDDCVVDSGTMRCPRIPIDEERGPVSVHSTLMTGPGRSDMALFANAAVDDLVEIALHTGRLPAAETVSSLFGDERITLEFYDVESLERLRDLADEGARRLRAAIEANARADAAESSEPRPPGDGRA
jgi:hypothetical protein